MIRVLRSCAPNPSMPWIGEVRHENHKNHCWQNAQVIEPAGKEFVGVPYLGYRQPRLRDGRSALDVRRLSDPCVMLHLPNKEPIRVYETHNSWRAVGAAGRGRV